MYQNNETRYDLRYFYKSGDVKLSITFNILKNGTNKSLEKRVKIRTKNVMCADKQSASKN